MTRAAVLVVPGSLDSRTGGYIYDRHIVDGLRAMEWNIEVRSLDESFPRPTASAVAHAAEVFAALPNGAVTLVDSLAFGVIPEIIERHMWRLRIVALVHLPLAADVGNDEETAARLASLERRSFAAASLCVVTGRAAIPLLEPYSVPPSRVVVIEPGTDPSPPASGSGEGRFEFLSVATLNPGKGHEDLLLALAAVPSREWHLTCAGSLARHLPTVARIRALIRELRLDDRVSLVGELEAHALEECYDRSDLFVLATFRETYGMAVAEALAHGLPVVSTLTGAIPDLVGSDAGLLAAPRDVPALTDALSRFLGDAELRVRLAAGARRVRPLLPRWDETVAKMAVTLESVNHE
jgi:glycosyltransferase involved in cell wall biosynthesis